MNDDLVARLVKETKPKYKSLREEILDSKAQAERLLSRVWRNPYEVLLLPATAGDEEVRAHFNLFRLALHPDKTDEPRAAEALAVATQAHAALQDPAKRRLYQRILKEAFDKTTHMRNESNREREKKGQPPLPAETFAFDLQLVTKRLFDEIEDKRQQFVKMDEHLHRKRKQELELHALREEYKLQTEEEWDKSRDERVKRWRSFQARAPRIGERGADPSIKFLPNELKRVKKT